MKKTVALTCALLAAVAMTLVCWWLWPRSSVNYLPQPRQIISMQPASSEEWIEIASLSADGVLLKTEVYYRNGETGTRIWRADKTLAKQIRHFKDGHDRMYAEYAPDGIQIVSGVETRTDGSVLWKASVDEKAMVTTTTYWTNGSTFESERRKVGAKQVDRWFFYSTGSKWQHFLGTMDGTTLTDLEEIWHQDGSLAYSHYVGLNGTSTDSIYRDNGTLKLKQYWALRPVYWSGDTTAPKDRRLLLKTETYSDDGLRLRREFMMTAGGYYADRVVDHADNGYVTSYELLYDGSVSSSQTVDASGKVVDNTRYTSRTTFKIPLTDEAHANYLDTLDARKAWLSAEGGATP